MGRPVESDRCRRNADTTGERGIDEPVMLARLVREPEEREKDERARDQRPAVPLEPNNHGMIMLPYEGSELGDAGIEAVRVGPAYPRLDAVLRVVNDPVYRHRNGSKNLDARKSHQTEVAAAVEVAVGRHDLSELMFTLGECDNGQDCARQMSRATKKSKTGEDTHHNKREICNR